MAQRSRLTGRQPGLDAGLLLILVLAGALRLQLAATQPYIHDENNTAIALSRTISFNPAQLHLPLRGENHGAVPAYVVKVSGMLFGAAPLGYRGLHVLLGLATIALVFRMTRETFGLSAARWAALVLAFNDYYLYVSSRATAHVPHLFFVALGLYAFSRFLATERRRHLYGAAAAIGGAFYCKESAALLLPVFGLVVVCSRRHRRWLWSPHVYLACATFVLVIGADLRWNSRAVREPKRIAYGGQLLEQATYRSHLDRIGGLGLSPYPLMFYERQVVQTAAARLTGRALADETPEYPSLNAALGAILLAAVALSTARRDRGTPSVLLFLGAFWGIFLFFSLIAAGSTRGRLDAASWIWVETTILSASVLTGVRVAGLGGATRTAAGTITGAALAWASAAPLEGMWRGGRRAGEEGWAAMNHAWQVLAVELVARVRARPLVAIAVAVAAGALIGLVIGVAAGRASRRRPAPDRQRAAALRR